MSIDTVAVTCLAFDDGGNPVSGTTFTVKLDITELDGAFVVPEPVSGTTDETGSVVLNLWPNDLGFLGSLYKVTATNPDTARRFVNGYARIPNEPCYLHECMVDPDSGVWLYSATATAKTVDASRELTWEDNNCVLELSADEITLTIPATGLQNSFACLVENSGAVTSYTQPASGVTANGDTDAVARSRVTNGMYLIRRVVRNPSDYTVTGN
jgi:hypothetical protein